MSPAEVDQILRLLERQGFRAEVMTTSPLKIILTIPQDSST